jgi:hypothetical protein
MAVHSPLNAFSFDISLIEIEQEIKLLEHLKKDWITLYVSVFRNLQKNPRANSINLHKLPMFGNNNTVRSKIKKIERAVINTLQLATRKNLIQMSSNVITIVTVIIN